MMRIQRKRGIQPAATQQQYPNTLQQHHQQRDDDSSTAYSTSICSDTVHAVHPHMIQQRPRKRRRTIVDQLQNCTLENASAFSGVVGSTSGCGSSAGGGAGGGGSTSGGGGGGGAGGRRHGTSSSSASGRRNPPRVVATVKNDDNSLLSEDEQTAADFPLEDEDVDVVVDNTNHNIGAGKSCVDDAGMGVDDPYYVDNEEGGDEVARLANLTDEEKAQRAIMLELVLGKDHPKTKEAEALAAAVSKTTGSTNANIPINAMMIEQQQYPILAPTSIAVAGKTSLPSNNPVDSKIQTLIRESIKKASNGENPLLVGDGSHQRDDMYLDTVYNRGTDCHNNKDNMDINVPPTAGGGIIQRERSNSLPMDLEGVEGDYNMMRDVSYGSTVSTTAATSGSATTNDTFSTNATTGGGSMDMD